MKVAVILPGKKFVVVVSSDASVVRLSNGGLVVLADDVTLDEQKAGELVDRITAGQAYLDVNPHAALPALEAAVKDVMPNSKVTSRVIPI